MPNTTKVITNHSRIVNHFNKHLIHQSMNQMRWNFPRISEKSITLVNTGTLPFPAWNAFVKVGTRNDDLREYPRKQFPVNWKAIKTRISRFTVGREAFLSSRGKKWI
jgi:hypothetical protein